MLKILIVTGDAGEAQEIYYAKYRLEEEGWTVHIAAPEKRAHHQNRGRNASVHRNPLFPPSFAVLLHQESTIDEP